MLPLGVDERPEPSGARRTSSGGCGAGASDPATCHTVDLDAEPPTEPEAGHHHARPHPGPPSTAARNLVVGTLIAFVVASNLGNVFLSVLVTERPLVFIGLNAQNRNLALASGELSAWSFYLVGFLRLVAPDPLFFLLGRWYGDAAIRWMERKAPAYGELLRMLERGFDKARFVVVAIAPNNPVSLFAGAAGMSFAAFMVANVVGTIGRLVLIRAFSDACSRAARIAALVHQRLPLAHPGRVGGAGGPVDVVGPAWWP